MGAALEPAAVDAGAGEGLLVGVREGVVAELAQEGGAEPEAGGVEGGVGGGTARGVRGWGAEQGDDAFHLVVVDEDHAAFFAGDVPLQEIFGDLGKEVHDG